jgi:hypothetical protein
MVVCVFQIQFPSFSCSHKALPCVFANLLIFRLDVISNLISKLFMCMSLIFCFYVSNVCFDFSTICLFFDIVCVRPLSLSIIKLVQWFLFSFVNSSLVEGVGRILRMTTN